MGFIMVIYPKNPFVYPKIKVFFATFLFFSDGIWNPKHPILGMGTGFLGIV